MEATMVRQVTGHPLLRTVRLSKRQVAAGARQGIAVTLRNPLQEVVVVSATVTYPNGDLDNLSTATTRQRGRLSWQVPPDAGKGEVSFVLSVGSGGCCGGDPWKRTFGAVPSVDGTFELVEPPSEK